MVTTAVDRLMGYIGHIGHEWLPLSGPPLFLLSARSFNIFPRKKWRSDAWLTPFAVILVLMILLESSAAAIPMYSRRSKRGPKPKWVNPCGINPKYIRNHSLQPHHTVIPMSDRELLQNVILAAKNAFLHSDAFKDRYVRKSFPGKTWESHHEAWKNQRLNWLPSWEQIPKHLHEQPRLDHLNELQMETALSKIYNYLQKIAVGLEQVVYDQARYDGDFIQEFNEAEYKLKAVLCELQHAMLERGVEPEDDVTRDIMQQSSRWIQNDGYRNMRDWYIYRDYMNGLEYVIHSFDHLKDQHK